MKVRAVSLLILAEIAAMSLWFVSAAILPDMLLEATISAARQAALSSGVQVGFVIGALLSAFFGIADRFDPRHVFALCAFAAAACNALLLLAPIGGDLAIALRTATGILLAGVYPVGMKIIVGWGVKDRGLLVGLLVGGLTIGTASPHLMSLLGGSEWRSTVIIASLAAAAAGVIGLGLHLGPHHARAPQFHASMILQAWHNRRIRLAYAGYLGHMWELYAMWAWVGVFCATSYSSTLPMDEATALAKLTAFCAIAAGAFFCLLAGYAADRIGKEETTVVAMGLSGLSALAVALSFGGPVWLTFALVVVWGISIIPDSAQFSALVADAADPAQAGSLMTLQTALGFALTILTVQFSPVLAEWIGWAWVIALMALGPACGIAAMLALRRLRISTQGH